MQVVWNVLKKKKKEVSLGATQSWGTIENLFVGAQKCMWKGETMYGQ